MSPTDLLLLALPLAIIAGVFHWGDIWVFLLSSIAIIPMAGLIGRSTEVLASYTGPRIGGLLNATLGNTAELIIAVVAIREGLLDLVKASITGSIMGNILLVLGLSMVAGGIKNGVQSFHKKQAQNNSILLLLAVLALVIPSLLSGDIGPATSLKVEALSIGVAIVMIVLYALGIFYSLRVQRGPLSARTSLESNSESESESRHSEPAKDQHESDWSVRKAMLMLGLSTAAVAFLSELLVGSVEHVVLGLGISEFFLGIILIPLIGNVSEHLVAVKVAVQNKMDLSVEIAVASSLQIALFVAPVLVFVSLLFGHPLTLIFNSYELLALIAGVLIAVFVSIDGESNWLEGAALLSLYLILGIAFFLLPA
jgi:Ca2+:H+ antiporter